MSLCRPPCRQALAVACAAVLLAGLSLGQSGDKPKKVALLVGVNQYDNRKFEDLKYAERDVAELAKELRAAGYEVRLLTGNGAGADRATKANIDKALAEVLKKVTKKDTLLVALAGHGQQVEVKEAGGREKVEAFFCPRDAVLGQPQTMVNMSVVLKHLDERGGGTNLVLVDACRNDPTPGRGRGIDGNRVEALPEGTAVLFSCSKGQRAFESRDAGGGHGVFFHFVLEGLRGKARNDKGAVTWDRLVAYVKEQVEEEFPKLVPDVPVRQVPHHVSNLTVTPVLRDRVVDLGKGEGTGIGKVERKEVSFKPLFNGKDLTGWSVYGGGTGSWKVVGSAIVSSGPTSHLFSDGGDYENFRYRVEAMINDKGNSGQYFRTLFGPGFPKGYEAQINATHTDKIRTGSLYFPNIPEVLVKEQLHRPNEWFTQEVIADDNHIIIKVNDKTTVDWKDPKNTYTRGHFALQQHDPGTVVKFRKIEVMELPSSKKEKE
jgi:hypothetical protein